MCEWKERVHGSFGLSSEQENEVVRYVYDRKLSGFSAPVLGYGTRYFRLICEFALSIMHTYIMNVQAGTVSYLVARQYLGQLLKFSLSSFVVPASAPSKIFYF